MPEIQFNLTEVSKMKVEMDDNGELYFYGKDLMLGDDEDRHPWEQYGTDLIPLIETHGSSRNVIGAIFEAQSMLIKITQWLIDIGIDESELTNAEKESAAEDHYYESKLDCEKEVESWMHN